MFGDAVAADSKTTVARTLDIGAARTEVHVRAPAIVDDTSPRRSDLGGEFRFRSGHRASMPHLLAEAASARRRGREVPGRRAAACAPLADRRGLGRDGCCLFTAPNVGAATTFTGRGRRLGAPAGTSPMAPTTVRSPFTQADTLRCPGSAHGPNRRLKGTSRVRSSLQRLAVPRPG